MSNLPMVNSVKNIPKKQYLYVAGASPIITEMMMIQSICEPLSISCPDQMRWEGRRRMENISDPGYWKNQFELYPSQSLLMWMWWMCGKNQILLVGKSMCVVQ